VTLTKEVKDYTMKTRKHGRKKLKTIDNGKTSRVHGLKEFILLKLPYYQKLFTYLMQVSSTLLWHSSQN
jgi:hypothetical protein